jgi:hypothetical protein
MIIRQLDAEAKLTAVLNLLENSVALQTLPTERLLNFSFSDYVNKLQPYKLLSVFILLAVQLCFTFFSAYNTVEVTLRLTVSQSVSVSWHRVPL